MTKDVELEYCDRCGWWCKRCSKFSIDECDPARGQRARDLAALVGSSIPSTQQGWGHGKLVFHLPDNTHVVVTIAESAERPMQISVNWARLHPVQVSSLVRLLHGFLGGK